MKKTIIALSILLNSLGYLCAQDFYTIFDADIEYSPSNDYIQQPANNIDIQENNTNLNLPLQRKNGDAFLIGLGAHKLRLMPHYNEPPVSSPNDTTHASTFQYYRYRIQFGYNRKISEEKSVVYMLLANVSSDLEQGLTSDVFQFGGAFLFSNKKSEEFTLKYGFYMNTEFFGLFAVPLLGLDWKVNEKTRIFGVLPARLTVQRKISERFRTGIMFLAPSYSYRVSEVQTGNPIEPTISTYLQNQKNVLSVYTDIYITKNIALQLRLGRTIFRRMRLYESDDVNTINVYGIGFGGGRRQPILVPVYRPFEDGWVLNASLSYRFNLE